MPGGRSLSPALVDGKSIYEQIATSDAAIYRYLFTYSSSSFKGERMSTQALSSAKWKEAAKAGFQLLPDVLLKKQSDLELSATDLVVLINITMHWWYADQRPFPRASVIASRMGVETRTVQRSMKRLAELGLLRKEIENKGTGRERQVCDLSGLVDRLDRIAQNDPDYLARTHAKEAPREAAI